MTIQSVDLASLPKSRQTVAHVLTAQAELRPDDVFVETDGERVTYAGAAARTRSAARALGALGITKGSRVGIMLRNSLEFLDIWFACALVGAIEMPISTEYREPQLTHVLRRSPPAIIFVDAGGVEVLAKCLAPDGPKPTIVCVNVPKAAFSGETSCIGFDAFLDFGLTDRSPALGTNATGSDIGAIMNTSGTTGPSKGVLMPHAQQYRLAVNIARDMRLTDKDVFYNFYPLFHNTSQAMITYATMIAGGRVFLRERFSLSRFWPDVVAANCTAFYYIGEILHLLVHNTTAADAAASCLRVGWGIGATPSDRLDFQSRYRIALGTGYGSTEANVPIFLHRHPSPAASAGQVIEGFEVDVVGQDGHPMAAGQVGEVLVRAKDSDEMMQGYDGDFEATRSVRQNGWFRTGDAGYFDANANFYFVNRLNDIIRVRGENVSPIEIEEVAAAFPRIAEAAAIAVPSDLGGNDIKVVIVARDPAPIDLGELTEFLHDRLPKYAVPRYIEQVAELPKTETNKLQRAVLRKAPFTARTWDCETQKFADMGQARERQSQ